jgi:hypothetical protein
MNLRPGYVLPFTYVNKNYPKYLPFILYDDDASYGGMGHNYTSHPKWSMKYIMADSQLILNPSLSIEPIYSLAGFTRNMLCSYTNFSKLRLYVVHGLTSDFNRGCIQEGYSLKYKKLRPFIDEIGCTFGYTIQSVQSFNKTDRTINSNSEGSRYSIEKLKIESDKSIIYDKSLSYIYYSGTEESSFYVSTTSITSPQLICMDSGDNIFYINQLDGNRFYRLRPYVYKTDIEEILNTSLANESTYIPISYTGIDDYVYSDGSFYIRFSGNILNTSYRSYFKMNYIGQNIDSPYGMIIFKKYNASIINDDIKVEPSGMWVNLMEHFSNNEFMDLFVTGYRKNVELFTGIYPIDMSGTFWSGTQCPSGYYNDFSYRIDSTEFKDSWGQYGTDCLLWWDKITIQKKIENNKEYHYYYPTINFNNDIAGMSYQYYIELNKNIKEYL